ncbi:MAG TPA: hypothetical protein VNQ14_04680 [Woeseiaceae bacterium]|nr:hypothetical protein [Woeseiaceae bacterium]
MRPIAAWLVARPQNAVIGLAGTLLLPFAQIISGTVMALLVFKHGPALAAIQGLIATAILAVISLLVSASVSQILANAMIIWVPVVLLVVAMRGWRSLTLTLQLSIIAAMLVTLGFYIALGDPTAFWREVLVRISGSFREMGLTQHADILQAQQDVIAPQMTVLVVLTTWSLYVSVLLFGYALYRILPGISRDFGRFRDLNLGRVLALTMALASVISLLTGAVWLQNFAFVIFAMFWLQGLSIVHWLYAEGRLPLAIVILVYALIPLLNALMIMALAVTGYIDAWFEFRSRKPAR